MIRTFVLLLAATLFAVACGPTLPTEPPTTITAARAVWKARGASDYDFSIRRDCYCMDEYVGPFTVSVRDGDVTATRSGAPVDPALLEGLPLTAEALFAFAEEREAQVAFRAAFDPSSGFLLSVWSDPIPMAADDELGLTISDFMIRD